MGGFCFAIPQLSSAGSDAAETSSWGQQREQSVGRVAVIIDDPLGFPYTPPGVDVLEGGKLTSNNVAGCSIDPLQSFVVASSAVSKPGGDAAGQDALHSAGVERYEDAGALSKLPHLRKKKRRWCAFFSAASVWADYVRSSVMWTPMNLKLFTRSTCVLSMVMCVCVLCSVSWNPPPSSLVLSMLSKSWFSWPHLVRVLTSSL